MLQHQQQHQKSQKEMSSKEAADAIMPASEQGPSVPTGVAGKLPPTSNKTEKRVSSSKKAVPTQASFDKECLSILREMNTKISQTNAKVENLAERVDSLYEEPQDSEFAAYSCPQEDDLQFSEYIDDEEVPADNSQVSVCESAASMKRQYDGDDVFNVFAKKFKKADVVDCEVNQNLADMINSSFREGIPDDMYAELTKNIHRPENCFALKETRVNAGVWSVLKPQTQTEDSKVRGVQNAVIKASCNIAKLLDKAAPVLDKQMLDWGSTAIAVLGQANKWLNVRRKESHKKDMDPKLHYLCSSSIPSSDLLYGDTMIKDIKDIQEMNKISKNVARGRGRGRGSRFMRRRGGFRGVSRVPQSTFPKWTPMSNRKSTEHKKEFKAGRLCLYVENWRKITNDPVILDIVLHCHLELTDTPVQSRENYPTHLYSKMEEQIIEKEMKNLLEMGVIEKVHYDKDQFLSPIFTRPKKNGEHRMILNLKELNQYVEYHHFKMDSFEIALKLIEKDCFMASVDLRHAYYSVNVAQEHRKYLRFIWKGQIYAYTSLANGVASAPRQFTKLMKPVYATLRQKGHKNSGYIDDSLLVGDTKQECENNVTDTVSLMENVGFIIHEKKSILIPVKNIVFLGNHIDSERMIVYLTDEKKQTILHECSLLRNKARAKIREVARVVGLIVSSFSAVQFGPLHYRDLEKQKILALKCSRGDFNGIMQITEAMRADLDWWLKNVNIEKREISHGVPNLVIITDASLLGWGAVCDGSRIGGRWSLEEKDHHINYLELLAVYHALRAFCKDKHDLHIQIKTDNVCCQTYINKMGGVKSPLCNEMAKLIWAWAIGKQIWLSAAYIPSKQNPADQNSRNFNDNVEWMLDRNLAECVLSIWDSPLIDMFASRVNKQLKRFVSWKNDPDAEAIDAFSMTWTDLYFYAFPPFSLIPRLLFKLREEQGECILVAPVWLTQAWFPVAMGMLAEDPYILPKARNLSIPGTVKVHPLEKKLILMACRLSGKHYRNVKYLQGLPTLSWPHGGQELKNSITCIYESGFSTVVKGKLVVFKFL